MRIVFISDTHGSHEKVKLPSGDVLVHSGDFTNLGRKGEIDSFNDWLGKQSFEHILVSPGNHDLSFESHPEVANLLTNASAVLIDAAYEIDGIKFYASPRTPRFGDWAFMYERHLAPWEELLPKDIDVLVTHGPPDQVLDLVPGYGNTRHVGCAPLNEWVKENQPTIHAFGHIHESRGTVMNGQTLSINAAHGGGTYGTLAAPFHGYTVDILEDGSAILVG
jgi:Icc-related predicted phosphoesterase